MAKPPKRAKITADCPKRRSVDLSDQCSAALFDAKRCVPRTITPA
jgi:hypothetical protein